MRSVGRKRRGKGRRTVTVSISLPVQLYGEMLKLIEAGAYISVTDLVRAAVRHHIMELRKRQGRMVLG